MDRKDRVIKAHESVGPDHPFRVNCDKFRQATAALREAFDLVSVTMVRFNWNLKYSSLCDHKGLSDAYWDHKFYCLHLGKYDFANKAFGKLFSDLSTEELELVKLAQAKLKAVAGHKRTYVFMRHYFGYSEVFVLTSKNDSQEYSDYLMSRRDLFYQYVRKLKNECREMITAAKEAAITSTLFLPKNDSFKLVRFDKSSPVEEEKVEKTKRYYLEGEFEGVYLNKTQVSCLAYLIKDMTYKEIGDKVFLSPRTVTNNLDLVREKLQCANKKMLIKKVKSDPSILSIISEVMGPSFNDQANHSSKHVVMDKVYEVVIDPPLFDTNCQKVDSEFRKHRETQS